MTQVPPTAALLDRVRRGDAQARRALLTAWAPTVLRWATRLGGPTVDAEDISQNALIRILTHLDGLSSPDAFPSWVFLIVRRETARHRRRAWLRRWLPGAVPDRPDPADGPARTAERSEARRRLWEALDTLPQPLREVLVLCDLEERTDDAVAELLGIPTGTVKSRLRRGRERLWVEARRRGLSGMETFAEREGVP